MTLDRQFLKLMPYQCTVQAVTALSTDFYGSRTLTAGVQWQCRIEQESRIYTSKDGREAKANATIYGPPYDTTGATLSIGADDKITLPTGIIVAGSTAPPILDVFQHADAQGTMYYEILL